MIPAHYLNSVVTGDARELANAIPDESIDLIFTDPVYQNIEDYRWLGEIAYRVLKPNSACLTWYGIGYLPQTISALLASGLVYRWQGIWYQSNRTGARADMGFCVYSPFLWVERGRSKVTERTNDLINFPFHGGEYNKFHHWNKQPGPIEKYLAAFTQPGALVFDPFAGGGTVPAVCKMLGRNYIAFEIDPDTAAKARTRIANTQPPLFTLGPQQIELDL